MHLVQLLQLMTLVATVDAGCIVSSLGFFPHSMGQIAHFGPPKSSVLANQANVQTFNKDTDYTLFRICCATCNGLHGVNNATVVTANYLAENDLQWPKIVMPTLSGLWMLKGRRQPHEVGKGFLHGYIPMPDGVGGWKFNPGSVLYFPSFQTQVC
jgi:hypothetical protein